MEVRKMTGQHTHVVGAIQVWVITHANVMNVKNGVILSAQGFLALMSTTQNINAPNVQREKKVQEDLVL